MFTISFCQICQIFLCLNVSYCSFLFLTRLVFTFDFCFCEAFMVFTNRMNHIVFAYLPAYEKNCL